MPNRKMARPGFEPGTPRFSGGRISGSNHSKRPTNQLVFLERLFVDKARKLRELICSVGHEMDVVAHPNQGRVLSATGPSNPDAGPLGHLFSRILGRVLAPREGEEASDPPGSVN